jgi:hypothetical protein
MQDEFLAPLILHVTCSKCTRARAFGVRDAADGRVAVARAGWIARGDETICPKCPQTPAERAARAKAASAQ